MHPNADTSPHVEPPHGSEHATSYGGSGGGGSGYGDGGDSVGAAPHTLSMLACWHASNVPDAPIVQSISHSVVTEFHCDPAPHALAADASPSSAQQPAHEHPSRPDSELHLNAETSPHVEPPHGSEHATSYGGSGGGGSGAGRGDGDGEPFSCITALASQFKLGPIAHGSLQDL